MSTELSRLSECTELNYILVGDLLDLLDEPASEQNGHWLSAVLDTLLKTLPEEYSLKTDDGYLSEVLTIFPDWQAQVDRLEEQNLQLIRRLRMMRSCLDSGHNLKRLLSALRGELRDWIDSFRKHHQEERRLMQMAVNLEIGGSG